MCQAVSGTPRCVGCVGCEAPPPRNKRRGWSDGSAGWGVGVKLRGEVVGLWVCGFLDTIIDIHKSIFEFQAEAARPETCVDKLFLKKATDREV